MNKKPIFILSFIIRYWPLLMVFLLFTALGHSDHVTYFVGPVFYLLSLMVACLTGALFVKHLCFRSTLDAYTQKEDEGGGFVFVREFWALPPEQRVWMTVIVLIALFLAGSWIAASIAK